MHVDTEGLSLSPQEIHKYGDLFRWILIQALHPNPEKRVKGTIMIPLSGNGTFGTVKLESFHVVNGELNGHAK